MVSFHVLEHLPNPLDTLRLIMKKVVSGGKVVIEVPHANDFLLSVANSEQFKQFTLWSQHLILHTRTSLRKTMEYVGLKNVIVSSVQRYPLSNHLYWLSKGSAGGHRSTLSMLDSDDLFYSYRNALARIDGTDTIVAVGEVP